MIELKRILQEANNGAKPNVWFSTKSLWWTNSKLDLLEATAIGTKALEAKGEKLTTLYCDPLGYGIDKTSAKDWLAKSISNPSWFGKNGLKAFVFTHHANCKSFFSNKWDEYNNYMDR